MQDIDKTLLGSIDVLKNSLTIELMHEIMRGALAHHVKMCACVNVAMVACDACQVCARRHRLI